MTEFGIPEKVTSVLQKSHSGKNVNSPYHLHLWGYTDDLATVGDSVKDDRRFEESHKKNGIEKSMKTKP